MNEGINKNWVKSTLQRKSQFSMSEKERERKQAQ